ncbi:MAG: hypothetical protein H6814_08410 [Phycisphaeraceae bacterium]|nr:hypothetical protein [Phycisphaeraceae bacterium]
MSLKTLRIGLTALCLPLALGGCASGRQSDAPVVRDEPPLAYAQVATRFNERTDRLTRIWANAVTRLSYLDEDGDRHTEQGEGHFQLIAPDRFALSVGKISEVLFWIGCDDERYWFFQLYEGERVTVGRNENLGRPCSRSLGLPASPLDIVDLLGVTPLPVGAPGATSWSDNGRWLVVDAPGHLAWRRLFLDPGTLLPRRVELYDPADTTSPLVIASIEANDRVELDGVGGFMPMAPSRLQIDHPASGTSIRLFLHNLNDGKTNGRLPDAVFTLESLIEAFGPREFIVLDEDCPNPALP